MEKYFSFSRASLKPGAVVSGREEGRAEGRAEAYLTVARNMKQLETPIDIIVKATGLTPEEIDAL